MIIFVRNLVVKDFWLKLFSLVLAILIWLTVNFSINKEVSPWAALIGRTADETDIPGVPVFVPPLNGRVVKVEPANVRVTVRGEPNLVKNLQAPDIRAQVNLAGVESASGLRWPVEIVLPKGVAFTHVEPSEVEVTMSPNKQ